MQCIYLFLNNFNIIEITKLFRKSFAGIPRNIFSEEKKYLFGFWGQVIKLTKVKVR